MVWTDVETKIRSTASLTSTAGVGLGANNTSYSIVNNVQILKRPSTQVVAPVGDVRKDYNNPIIFSGVIDAKNATVTTGGKVSWDLLEDLAQTQDTVEVNDEIFTAGAWQEVVIQSVRASKAQNNIINFVLTIIKTG